ncbi:MAG TPA: PQQ-binding-like beta-propeller repeat protein [Solirubrobacteraceae bacterium]
MSAFVDALTHGTWYVQAAGGGYLAPSSQTDPSGNAYLGTAPTRATASKFAFKVTSTISPTSVQATLTEVSTNRQLSVNGENAVVLAHPSSSGSTFTVSQRRPSVFSMQTASGGSVMYSSAQSRFVIATGASPTLMQLAIDPPAGPLLWLRQLGSVAMGAPATFGGYQVVSGSTPLLTCVEAFTGRITWEFGEAIVATSPPVVSWTARSAIVAAGSTVHAVSIDSAAEKWKFTASSAVYARPRASAAQVFVCASYGVLHALSAADGTEQWRFPAQDSTLEGLYTTVAICADTLYLGAWDGSLYAIDALTGKQRWSYASGDKINGVVLATEEGVYFGNDSGAIVALEPDTGDERWTVAADGIIQSRPALHGGLLLVASFAGTVHALNATSGAQSWTCSVGAPVVSDITVSDDVAYMTTTTGQVCALALSPSGPPNVRSTPLGGPSAGSVSVFSGAVNASTLAGLEVSNACELRTDLHPQDHSLLLQGSDIANRLTSGQTPSLPPGWTLAGTCFASNSLAYATALVATLRRPSDDAPVVLVAFGVNSVAFLNFYDPTLALLKALPASIAGSHAPAGVEVTDSVLDNYASMRSTILTLLGGLAGKSVMVTGQGQGGALATLAALDYAIVKSDTPAPAGLTCVSFGAPALGNAGFTALYNSSVASSFRAIVAGDLTVSSLGSGWQHVRAPVSLGQGFPEIAGAGTVALYAQAMAGLV